MADAKKCDSCAKFYEPYTSPVTVWKKSYLLLDVVDYQLDLCKPCFKGLSSIGSKQRLSTEGT